MSRYEGRRSFVDGAPHEYRVREAFFGSDRASRAIPIRTDLRLCCTIPARGSPITAAAALITFPV